MRTVYESGHFGAAGLSASCMCWAPCASALIAAVASRLVLMRCAFSERCEEAACTEAAHHRSTLLKTICAIVLGGEWWLRGSS